MKYLHIFFLSVFSLSVNAGGQACEVVSWKAERIDRDTVSVFGFINYPNRTLSIEVWKNRSMVGDRITYSNHRGAFRTSVHTIKKAPKYPHVVISCR